MLHKRTQTKRTSFSSSAIYRSSAPNSGAPDSAAPAFDSGNPPFYDSAGFLTLDMLPIGARATVREVLCGGFPARRMMDLGLIPGAAVRALYQSPLGDPVAYEIFGAVIAIRKKDASAVRIQILLETIPTFTEKKSF